MCDTFKQHVPFSIRPSSTSNQIFHPFQLISEMRVVGYQDHEISLNDGEALTNLAILCLRKTSCSFPQSLHRSRRLPEILLYFGFITSSSSMHSITFPQSHEIKCLGIDTLTQKQNKSGRTRRFPQFSFFLQNGKRDKPHMLHLQLLVTLLQLNKFHVCLYISL